MFSRNTTQLNQESQLKKQAVHIYIPKFTGSLKQFKSNNQDLT